MKISAALLFWVFGLMTLTACGQAVAQNPTPIAPTGTVPPAPTFTAVPTQLPTSTFTPTPIPYDLTLIVSDDQGVPISGASVVFPESGEPAPVETDAEGKYSWTNLPGPSVSLNISAPGYFSNDQNFKIERGSGQISVKLDRDPFGLLPAKACAADEKLLYIEDFQDGKAQGFQNISAAVDFAADNGWGIGPMEPGNQVALFKGVHENLSDLDGYSFTNAVWRIKVQTIGKGNAFSFLDWRHSWDSSGDARYVLQWADGGIFVDLSRLQADVGHFSVKRTSLQMKQQKWYYIEISTFDDTTQVWIDGKKLVEYKDPKPLPAGTLALEAHNFKEPNISFYFDDLSVCELSAPITSSLFVPNP